MARSRDVVSSWSGLLLVDGDVLLGSRVAGRAEALPQKRVGVEIDLPIMVVVGAGPHCEHGPEEVEIEDFDLWGRLGHDVRDGQELLLQERDGRSCVHRRVQLRRAVDAPKRVGGIVLNVVAEDLLLPTNDDTLSGEMMVVAKRPTS